ncbi:MAG: DUF2147 domain-containing protein, partial [Chitinophagaceae bacterium]
MKRALILFLLALGFATGALAQDGIIGKWWSPRRDGQIEIYKTNGQYFGKLIWAQKSGKKDIHNPDASLRQRDVVGLNLFTNFHYDDDDGEWVDGKVYDPSSGKVYSCKLWLSE